MDPNDLKIEAWPPPATTGMHVGMPNGVRVTHLPTGLVATCNTERSQHANRDEALRMIAEHLEEDPTMIDSNNEGRNPWRPMSEAPRDGRWIVMLTRYEFVSPAIQIVKWIDERGWCFNDEGDRTPTGNSAVLWAPIDTLAIPTEIWTA